MTFAEYVASEWINVGCENGRYYITRDVAWTIGTMAREGWTVARTGTEQMADDTIRTYIALAT